MSTSTTAFEDIVFIEEPATDLMAAMKVALEELRSWPDTYFAEKQRTLSLLNDQVVGAERCFSTRSSYTLVA